ncbi:MAG: hypothetical protein LUD25_02580 [Coriobacteriaceae bacterium]|nr:hypothetical protein [Coriobacteriaceae bacterium]
MDYEKQQSPNGMAGSGAQPGAGASKLPFLSPEEGERQLQAQRDAERMTDEEFDALWKELRQDALEAEGRDDVLATSADDRSALAEDAQDDTVEDAQEDAEVIEEEEPDEELTFDESVDRLMDTVNNTPRFREILRKTLVFCQTRRMLREVEDEIQTYPEYEQAAENPYRLIRYLIDGDGLYRIELDEEGEEVTADRKEGLTEDEIDDLIFDFALETTPVGAEVANRLAPHTRIRDLLNLMPVRFDSYVNVLEFCQEPRTMKEIDALFEGVDMKALGIVGADDSIAIQPSVFVDKLERAGALVWKGNWNLTAEGKAFLETVQKARA